MEGNSCTKICRFCLETSNSNFQTVEEVTVANLDFLWLKLNSTVSEGSVMCGNCAVTITINSVFKTKCLEMEDCIVSSVKDKDSIKINLREVYVSKMSVENIVVPEHHIICRLCLELVKNDSAILLRNSTDIVEKLEQYFPELDLTCTEDPVICGSCQHSLQCYFSFINTCLTTEEKITEYCKVNGINGMGQIDLNSLMHFILSKDFLKCKFEVDTLKIEETYNEDSDNAINDVEVKKEEILDMELDIENDNSTQESELTNEIRFQHHSSPSHSDCVLQLTGVKPARNTCEICGECKLDVQPHMITYKDGTEVTMYKCDLCDLETKQKSNSKESMLTDKTYSEMTMYKCDLCDYKAKRKSDLSRQTRNPKSHSDITMYKCDLCIYQTKWKSVLKRHMLIHKTHSEITMYKCDQCDYKAKLKANLKVHMLIHKTHLETITYKCDLCDYVAKVEKNIKRHIMNHKPDLETTIYKCDLCDYQTKWKSCLPRHVLTHKTHSEVTTYKCDLCHYKAKEKYILKRHMVTHETHSEIYKCEACAYETRRKEYLKRHMRSHMEVSKIEMKSNFQKHLLSYRNTPDVPSNLRNT